VSVRYSFSSQPQSGGNDVVLIMETFDNACSSPAWTRVASPIVLSRQLHNTLQRDEKGRPVIHNLVQCKRSQNCEFDSKRDEGCVYQKSGLYSRTTAVKKFKLVYVSTRRET